MSRLIVILLLVFFVAGCSTGNIKTDKSSSSSLVVDHVKVHPVVEVVQPPCVIVSLPDPPDVLVHDSRDVDVILKSTLKEMRVLHDFLMSYHRMIKNCEKQNIIFLKNKKAAH